MSFSYLSSCKKAKEVGKYYINIYFSEGEENRDPDSGRDFKYFKATYINAYKDEHKAHLMSGSSVVAQAESA